MSNLTLICIRDAGDKPGEDIVDPLLTDENVMIERARNFFNENESNRIHSTNLCPLKAFVLPTSLVRVSAFDESIYEAELISTEINISISDNSVTMDSTEIVERLVP